MITSLLETGISNAIAAVVLAAAALLATRLKAREPFIHSLWVLVLVKLVTPPLFHVPFSMPAREVATVERRTDVAPSTSVRTPQASSDASTYQATSPQTQQITMRQSATASSVFAMIFGYAFEVLGGIWLVGSLFVLCSISWRAFRFQRLLAYTELAPRSVRRTTQTLSSQVGLRRAPAVRVTTGVISPLVWCPLPFSKPTIVLPSRLLDELTDNEQATLLLHELAHLRRRDHWVRWLEVITTVSFWWHPVVWWARRELQRAGDVCCDGWVLSCEAGESRSYANTLVTTIDFLAEAKPALPPMASAVGQAEFLERRVQMILSRKLTRELSWPLRAVVLLVAAVVLPLSSKLVAEEETTKSSVKATPDATAKKDAPTSTDARAKATEANKELPRAGILEVVITAGDEPIVTKSFTRAAAKLESLIKAQARRPDATASMLVAINVNETTREFTDAKQALKVIQGISEVLAAAKRSKIQLGEIGRLDLGSNQSQQTQSPPTEPTGRAQQYRPTNAKDGADGYGIGGGLGGQGGGGYGIATQQQFLAAVASRQRGPAAKAAQIELLRQKLSQLLTPDQQTRPTPVAGADKPAPKEFKLGKATLFARMVHRDYEKATFSFEFEVRDDPTFKYANDWDLQYGNGGDHFHVTMVSDDRSRIIDLGKMDWEQLDTTQLQKLPPHPMPRRDFVPSTEGHIYMVHTVDRNSDLYALFRVEAIQRQQGTCDITWRRLDPPQ